MNNISVKRICAGCALALALAGCDAPGAPPPEEVGELSSDILSAPESSLYASEEPGVSDTPEPLPEEPEPAIDLATLERQPLVPDSGEAFALYEYRDNPDVYLPYPLPAPDELDAAFLEENGERLRMSGYSLRELFAAGDTAYAVMGDGVNFASVRATVLRNVSGVREVVFLRSDGERVEFDPPGDGEITLPAHTPEQLAEIRAEIPYPAPGYEQRDWLEAGAAGGLVLRDSAVAGALEAYLNQLIVLGNIPQENFSYIQDATAQRFVINAAAWCTPSVMQDDDERLDPLRAVSDYRTSGPFGEHVIESARRMFGPETEISFDGYGSLFRYDPYSGMLSIQIADYYYSHAAAVLDYAETADGYEATVAFLDRDGIENEEGLFDDIFEQRVPAEDLERYLRGVHPKKRVVIQKGEGGALYLRSCESLDSPTDPAFIFERIMQKQVDGESSYGGVVRFGEGDAGIIEQSARFRPHELTLDAHGDRFYIIPTFSASAVRVEALDWSLGEPRVREVVYQHQMRYDEYRYHLRLQVATESEQPRYRIAITRGETTVEYLLATGEDGRMLAPPDGIVLLDLLAGDAYGDLDK